MNIGTQADRKHLITYPLPNPELACREIKCGFYFKKMDTIRANKNLNLMQVAFDISNKIQSLKIATVFFNYSGHVNLLTISIHEPYWVTGSDPTFSIEIKGDKGYSERNKKNLLALKEYLLNQTIPSETELDIELPF